MNVCILSVNPKLGSTRRMKEVLRARGHKVRVLHPLKFRILLEEGQPALFYEDKPLPRPDAVIPRIGHSKTFFGTAVVRQFEQMGVYALNSSHAITVSRNKLQALQQLSRHGVGIPRTVFVPERSSMEGAIELAGGAPVVIKLLEGTQGIGVILAETEAAATAILETMQSTKQDVLVQRFIGESRGRDVRALVVGGKVISAVRRTAQEEGEFRSNVHRGATAASVRLDPAYAEAAARAAQILGLEVAGVDMLESDQGPKVMEVNSSPSLEGMEQATGADLVTPVIEHLEARAQLPPVDVRQRLTLPHGHGVADLPVPTSSPLVGQSLRDAGLRDRGVQVLSVQREGDLHVSPRGDFEVAADDVLLCFGSLETIRALLTPRKKRRKKEEGEGQGSS